jgi:hypothetical protein
MLRRIMVRAHELARGMEGDYQARLALALRIAWKEERGKEEVKIEMKELKGSEKQVKFANDIKEAVLEIVEQLPKKIAKYSKDEEMKNKYLEIYNKDIKGLLESYENAGDFIGDWKAVVYEKAKSQRVKIVENILREKGINITRRIMNKFLYEYVEQECDELDRDIEEFKIKKVSF